MNIKLACHFLNVIIDSYLQYMQLNADELEFYFTTDTFQIHLNAVKNIKHHEQRTVQNLRL